MKPEYDFSRAERGKFYREEAEIRLPCETPAPTGKDRGEKRQRFGRSGESNFDRGSGTR